MSSFLIALHTLLLHYVFSAACLGKSVCQDMWKRAVNNLDVGLANAAGVDLNVNIPPPNIQPPPTVFQTQNVGNPNARINQPEFASFNGNFFVFVRSFSWSQEIRIISI